MSKREADEAWAFHRALADETKPHYEASRVDASTWRVRRWKGSDLLNEVREFLSSLSRATEYKSHPLGFEDSLDRYWKEEAAELLAKFKWDDEALLRDLPADTTEEQAIQVAVERGSWA